MPIEAPMQKLWWRFYFAAPSRFVKPGLYFCWRGNWRIVPLLSLSFPELIEFPEQTIIYAKDQPEYRPLPAYKLPGDPEGTITFCWRLSWRDRLRVLAGGVLWHQVLTFNQPLQPQLLLTRKPYMPKPAGSDA